MKTLSLALKSKTVWTIAALFVVGGIQNTTQVMPVDLAHAVNGVLALLAIYFKLNPSQDYGQKA